MLKQFFKKGFNSAISSYFAAVVVTSLVTGILWLLRINLEKAHIGLIYLFSVEVIAALYGTRPAVLSALLSFLLWNFFFLPPHFTFELTNVKDWILLIVFLGVAIIAGHITGKMRLREKEAVDREKEMMSFYRASLFVNTESDIGRVLSFILEQIKTHTQASASAVVLPEQDGKIKILAGNGSLIDIKSQETEKIIKWAIANAKSVGFAEAPLSYDFQNIKWPISVAHRAIIPDSAPRKDIFLPLFAGEHSLGLLYCSPSENGSFSIADLKYIIAFSTIIISALEREKLIKKAAAEAALRESEHAKSVLFSSLSHNLKNPLVSLTATLGSLKQSDITLTAETISEHIELMSEDIMRLTENINNLLNLSRLEAGLWKPNLEWYDFREIISIVTGQLSEAEYKRVKIEIPDEFLLMHIDSVQISQVLRHLLENALQYSPEPSNIIIGAELKREEISFWIDDAGPGIPEHDRETIFRKFYGKREGGKRTGLGLPICREIARAHKGKIEVEDSPCGGARFKVTLPVNRLKEGKYE